MSREKLDAAAIDGPGDDAMTARVQACGFVIELSPDWLILRASANAHRFLGEYPQALVGEPLARFTLAQPLHDLRNSLVRQRSATGIARAYRIRLTEDRRHFDIAFQLFDDRIILEGIESPNEGFGEALGAVSRLIDGLSGDCAALLDGAARRIRALTGFDRAMVMLHGDGAPPPAESSRSSFAPLTLGYGEPLPALIADTAAQTVALFEPAGDAGALRHALLRAPSEAQLRALRDQGIRAMLNVPLYRHGQVIGSFRCDHRAPLQPSFELHAAAELFAQMLAMRLELAER